MPRYWKSVDQLKGDPAFERFIEDEFPSRSEEWLKPVNRREVLRLMAASFALAGLNACTRQPKETIVPYFGSRKISHPASRFFSRPRCRCVDMPAGSWLKVISETNEDRRKSATPNQSGRDGRVRASIAARSLRSRSLAHGGE